MLRSPVHVEFSSFTFACRERISEKSRALFLRVTTQEDRRPQNTFVISIADLESTAGCWIDLKPAPAPPLAMCFKDYPYYWGQETRRYLDSRAALPHTLSNLRNHAAHPLEACCAAKRNPSRCTIWSPSWSTNVSWLISNHILLLYSLLNFIGVGIQNSCFIVSVKCAAVQSMLLQLWRIVTWRTWQDHELFRYVCDSLLDQGKWKMCSRTVHWFSQVIEIQMDFADAKFVEPEG